ELLQYHVAGGDDAGVRLEAALRHDEVGELLREVDVRHLERTARQRAEPVRAGRADLGVARVERGTVRRRPGLLEARGVDEGGEHDAADGLRRAVAERANDRAVLGERERVEGARVAT